jgi:hypothetical protein
MTTPNDAYSMVLTSQQSPAAPNKSSTGSLERFLHRLFLLFVMLAVFGFMVWIDGRFSSEVVSSQSIGKFLRMSGPGGLSGDVVIETEQGSYVLRGTPAVPKGTRLIMEVRASGAHYICDESRSLCIQTSSKKFKANDAQQAPNGANPSPPQGQKP